MDSTRRPQARINPALIPDGEYEVACSVLASSIRLALMNPELRKEYENWKAAKTTKQSTKYELRRISKTMNNFLEVAENAPNRP